MKHNVNAAPRRISADSVRRHYDIMSLPYRIFWGEHLHHGFFSNGRETPRQAQLQLLDYVSGRATIRAGARVLDVGCGYGGTAIYLAQNFQCRVDAVTLSSKQARIARKQIARAGLSARVNVILADVERFQIQGQYDVVWMMESSEHLRDKAGFITRAAGLLQDGGLFMIAAWTGSATEPLVREIAELSVCPGFQTAPDYVAQLQAAGLRSVVNEDLTQSVLRTWEVCRARVARLHIVRRLIPEEIRRFLGAIPLMISAYRDRRMSYTLIIAQKESPQHALNSTAQRQT
jgi:tocopherol O-methyltransferase